jgi:hypothetical protein
MHRKSARLALWQKWLFCLSFGALWLTGAAWLVLHHYGTIEGPFGPETNPFEPWMMKLHGLFLIPALLAIGGTFIAHIPKGWAQQRQRAVGVVLCSVLGLLVASGYLIYYAGGEGLREWSSVIHWAIGLAFPAVLALHWIKGVAARKSGNSGGILG